MMKNKRNFNSDITEFLPEGDGRLTAEYEGSILNEFDMTAYIKFVKEKYNGDSSKVTKEEMAMFLRNRR